MPSAIGFKAAAAAREEEEEVKDDHSQQTDTNCLESTDFNPEEEQQPIIHCLSVPLSVISNPH